MAGASCFSPVSPHSVNDFQIELATFPNCEIPKSVTCGITFDKRDQIILTGLKYFNDPMNLLNSASFISATTISIGV